MKKWLVGIVVAVVLLAIGGGAFAYQQLTKPKVVHYHAGVVVFVDGKKQDFANGKYMSFEPCALHANQEKSTPEHEQMEKAHLHDFVGDVVHVHRSNAAWGDLFRNIGYHIDYAKGVEGYINGEKVDQVLSKQIKPYDSLVLLLGKHGDVKQYLKQAVTKQHVQQVEKKSELCSS